MRNWELDGWSEQDWSSLEVAASAALWAGRQADDIVGCGGGALSPGELDPIIQAMESAINRLKAIRANY